MSISEFQNDVVLRKKPKLNYLYKFELVNMVFIVAQHQHKSFSTLEIFRNGMWAFTKGFADSLRGAVDLFLLDYRYLKGLVCPQISFMDEIPSPNSQFPLPEYEFYGKKTVHVNPH